MAKVVLKDVGVSVGGNDLSAQVQQATLNYSAGEQDVTAMGDDSIVRLASLKDWSMEVTFFNDFGDAALDSILFPLVGGAVQAIKLIVVQSSVVSTSNPMFTGNALVSSYPPVGQTVGDAATTSVSFSGSGDLTRATTGTF